MPVRDGFEEDDTLELFFSNGWDDAVPFGTLVIALLIFTVWHRLTL